MWFQSLNFDRAIQEIKENEKGRKDFYFDPLRFEDLTFNDVRDEIKKEATKRLKQKNYKPKGLLKIDIPKSNYLLRPGARPNLIDWIIFESVTSFIASKIWQKTPGRSFTFKQTQDLYQNGKSKRTIQYWLDFEEEALNLSKKNKFLVVTDITSFYENISIEALKDILLGLENDKDYVAAVNFLIKNLLIPWSVGRIEGFGLPQGPKASGILADLYLFSVDSKQAGGKFIRYMDDMRLYVSSEKQLKEQLKVLVKTLRDIKLNLNAKKTNYYETSDKDLLRNVFDPEKSTLEVIDKAIDSKDPKQITLIRPSLSELFEKSKDDKNTFSERYLKFFVRRTIDLMKYGVISESEIKTLLQQLFVTFKEKHYLADLLCWFFLCSAQYDKSNKDSIRSFLLSFLADSEHNLYEWQEAWVIDTLRQLKGLSQRDLAFLRGRVNRHNLCHSQILLILGENNNLGDIEKLAELFRQTEHDSDMIRFVVIALQVPLKNGALARILKTTPLYLRKYLEHLQNPKYGFETALAREEILAGEAVEPYGYGY